MFTDISTEKSPSRFRDGLILSLGLGLGAALACYLSGREQSDHKRYTLYDIANEAVHDLVEVD